MVKGRKEFTGLLEGKAGRFWERGKFSRVRPYNLNRGWGKVIIAPFKRFCAKSPEL